MNMFAEGRTKHTGKAILGYMKQSAAENADIFQIALIVRSLSFSAARQFSTKEGLLQLFLQLAR
jgi:hypothetical protein